MDRLAPVVLVEDDPADAFFVRQALEDSRIDNPLVVFDSAEGARAFFSTPDGPVLPAVVILDLHLSGPESGLDLLRWLRGQPPPLAGIPAMILTGHETSEITTESSELGTICVLQKPVTEGRLADAVRSLGFVVVTSLVSGRVSLRLRDRSL